MESIKTKLTNAPQMSGIKTIAAAAVPTGAATYTVANATSGYGDNFKIVVPKGAIILATPWLVKTVFAGGTNYKVDIGTAGTAYNDDGTVHNSGNADIDGYFVSSAATTASAARGMFGQSGDGNVGYLNGAGLGAEIGNKATYVLANSGDKEYAVHLNLTVSGGGATSAGELIWWVEYGFDANIVWEQASLA